MTMQTDVDGFHRCETANANPEIDFESFIPVLMMSAIGLTLSLFVVAVVARWSGPVLRCRRPRRASSLGGITVPVTF